MISSALSARRQASDGIVAAEQRQGAVADQLQHVAAGLVDRA